MSRVIGAQWKLGPFMGVYWSGNGIQRPSNLSYISLQCLFSFVQIVLVIPDQINIYNTEITFIAMHNIKISPYDC